VSVPVSRSEFLVLLETVQPGLSSKDVFEQSSCFVFDNGWLCTFNGEVACRIRSTLPDEYTGAVDAAPLVAALQKLGGETVELELTDRELVVSGASGARVGVRLQAEVRLPIEQIEKPGQWLDLPEDFTNAVEIVQETAGTQRDQFIALCVHMHPKWLESCDRWQATRYRIRLGHQAPFLVRAASLKHVVRFGMHRMAEAENWVHFRNKSGLIYSLRRFAEPYPVETMDAMFNVAGDPVNLPKGSKPAAELGGVFSGEDKDNDKVTVTLTRGRMTVRGEGAKGWAEVPLEMPGYKGAPVQFRISPKLLGVVTDKYNECEIAGDKLIAEGERWCYVTALGPVDEKPKSKAAPKASEPEPEPESNDPEEVF